MSDDDVLMESRINTACKDMTSVDSLALILLIIVVSSSFFFT